MSNPHPSLFELSPQNQPVPDSFKVMTNLLLENGANKEVIRLYVSSDNGSTFTF